MKVLTVVVSFFSPIAYMFALIGCAIMVDTLFGRWAAKHYAKKNGLDVRKHVTSTKTKEGVIGKIAIYNLVMLSIFIIDDYLLNQLLFYWMPEFPVTHIFSKLIGVVLILNEADSVDEKYYLVKGVRIRTQISSRIKTLKTQLIELVKFKNDLNQ